MEEGEMFLRRGLKIISEADDLIKTLMKKNKLRITAGFTYGSLHVSTLDVISQYQELHPNIDTTCQYSIDLECEHLVFDKTYNLACVAGKSIPSLFNYTCYVLIQRGCIFFCV
ncbi:MAG: hypothetical protein ACOWWH_04850 [Eubacteriaceae bacterium]